jgi:hypothetical protein
MLYGEIIEVITYTVWAKCIIFRVKPGGIYKNYWALKKVKVGIHPDFVLKKVPRKILGSKRDEVKGDWRKLRNVVPRFCTPSLTNSILRHVV